MNKQEKAIWNKLKNQYADNEEVLDVLCGGENARYKQIPKKPNDDDCCTVCNTYLKDDNGVEGDYCPNCGQAIDWRREDE